MAIRDFEAGRGIVIVPASVIKQTERDVDTKRAAVFIAYPDDTNGGELAAMMKEATAQYRMHREEQETEP